MKSTTGHPSPGRWIVACLALALLASVIGASLTSERASAGGPRRNAVASHASREEMATAERRGGTKQTPGAEGPARAAIRLDVRQRQLTGLTYGTVERRSIERTIRTVGHFAADERTIRDVTLKVGGYIVDLFVDFTGRPVHKGEPLFSIYSPDLVSAEQEYLLAVQTERRLAASGVPGAKESAASLVRASKQRLLLWDLTESQVRELAASGKPSFRRTIRSPAAGVVLEKRVVAGQAVQAGMTLYRIADLSRIWVYGDVYEYEVPFVKIDQAAEIRLSYVPNRTFHARVAYVYPTLDPKTRTVKVRFELENTPDRLLRPDMYGDVALRVPLGERLVVPKTAVLDSGRRQIVFVGDGDGHLTPHEVELGDRADDYVEVRRGLAAGERVVTSANFLVDSESQLQAAESMMGMMGAIGMGDWKMESAKPMSMGGEHGAAAEPGRMPVEEKRVGDLRIALLAAAPGAAVGESAIRVRLRDADGAGVTRAKVSFHYTMDMPGMRIATAQTKEIGDGLYEGTARFTMGGPWSVIVQVERPHEPMLRERFVLRVRG